MNYGENDPILVEAIASGKYMVTPDGRVWNLDFRGTGRPVECKQHINTAGYLVVTVEMSGRKVGALVHRLVLLRYLGAHPERRVANHRDGVKTNNHIDNLEWVEQSDNVKHAWAAGLRGSSPGFKAKLTDNDVRRLHELSEAGRTRGQIAFALGVTPSAVENVLRGRSHAAISPLPKERERGRRGMPDEGWAAKLTPDQVRQIHREYMPHSRAHGLRAIARRFGLSRGTIANIVSGKSWPHIYREFHPEVQP